MGHTQEVSTGSQILEKKCCSESWLHIEEEYLQRAFRQNANVTNATATKWNIQIQVQLNSNMTKYKGHYLKCD